MTVVRTLLPGQSNIPNMNLGLAPRLPGALTARTANRKERPFHRRFCRAPTASAQTQQREQLRLELPTGAVQAGLRFTTVPKGPGTAVVVQRVQGSPLIQAGVSPGMQLLGISDPIQSSQVWPLSDNASLKYVLQAVRMRNSPTVTLVLSSSPVVPDLAAAAALAEAAVSAGSSSATQRGAQAAAGGSPGAKEELGLLDALVASMEEEEAGKDSGSEQEGAGGPTSLAERLEELAQVEQRQVSAYKKRVKKRKEYMTQVKERNDGGFFLFMALAFLGPALLGLALAFGTGYMDKLFALY